MKPEIVRIQFVLDTEQNLGITSEGQVYRLPFESNGKKYCLKRILPKFHSGQYHYRLQKKRYSQKQINEHKEKLASPKNFELYQNIKLQ